MVRLRCLPQFQRIRDITDFPKPLVIWRRHSLAAAVYLTVPPFVGSLGRTRLAKG